jgi:hypothetical protein
MEKSLPIIKVVGMSAAGKSTLVVGLRERGYDARPISQEHSNMPELWRHFELPDILIHLNLTLAGQRSRRPDVSWTLKWHRQETQRLAHALDHADLKIDTSELTAAQVLDITLHFLKNQRIANADKPLTPIVRTGSSDKSQKLSDNLK